MRTVSPQKKFLSTNPDYVFGSNTAGNFIPPYTGYYYMRAVGGGGSSRRGNNLESSTAGGGGGGYDGEVFLKGGVLTPYSVGIGGSAPALGYNANNGTDTLFGNMVLGGGYGGGDIYSAQSGRGGYAGMYKGGISSSQWVGRQPETPQAANGLFGGGGGITALWNGAVVELDFLANACGKNGRSKILMDNYLSMHNLKRGGSTVFGVSSNELWDGTVPFLTNFGTGGDLYFFDGFAQAGKDGRIEIWRLQ